MPSNRKIIIDLSAQYAQFSQGMQKVGKDVDGLRNNIEHLKKAAAGAEVFDKLREGLGKKSAIGEASELLRGGGPIKGLTGAAETLKSIAEGAAKLKEEFQSGKKSAAEIGEELIKQIPIVGSFWQAGRAIRELFTHEGADLEAANTTAKVLDETLKSQRASMERLAAEARSYAEYWAKAAEAIRLSQMPENTPGEKTAKDLAGSQNSEADELRRLQAERAEALQKANDANQKTIDDGRKAASEAQSKANTVESTSDDANEINVAKAHAQQLGSIVNMAVTQQREEQAKINADYDGRERIARQKAAYDRAAIEDKAHAEQQKAVTEAAEKDGKAIADAQGAAQEAGLRAKGQNYQADVIALNRSLAERLQAIQKEAAEEAKLFNADDQQNQQAVQAMAAAKAAAAQAETTAKIEAAAAEEKRKRDEQAKDMIEDAMAGQRAMEEDARKLTEESISPAQKYAEEVERINALKAQGLITDQTQQAALAKANESLLSSVPEADHRKVGAEVRRFDFNIGQREKPQDPIEALKQLQQRQLESAKKTEDYMRQIKDQGLLPPQVGDW